jgi:transmembrane sensor
MTGIDSRAKLNAQVCEEAAEWFVEFRTGGADAEVRRQFNAWLRQSPDHVRAYLETAVVWNTGVALDPKRRYQESDLIALAGAEDTVVRLDDVSAPPTAVARRAGAAAARAARRLAIPALYGIAASLLVVAVVELTTLTLHRGIYATEIGEQRSIALADGSTVELNSRSRIRVRFADAERSVDLLAGQALFRVAKDKMRPFVVRSGDASIRAVGTEFDVYQKRQGTVITVIEGRVSVGDSLLAAGEQLTVASTPTSTSAARPVHANIAAATAWTQRQLVFESATLADVADEINRYNDRQLVIDDAGLNDFHISGVFSSTDPASLVRFLRTRRDIIINETGDVIHVSRR